MSHDPGLQAAMIRLATAERLGRASLAGGNHVRMHMLEIIEAARRVRYEYMRILGDDADDLKTRPVGRSE